MITDELSSRDLGRLKEDKVEKVKIIKATRSGGGAGTEVIDVYLDNGQVVRLSGGTIAMTLRAEDVERNNVLIFAGCEERDIELTSCVNIEPLDSFYAPVRSDDPARAGEMAAARDSDVCAACDIKTTCFAACDKLRNRDLTDPRD